MRGGLHAQHRRRAGDHQDDRSARSSTAAGRKAGSSRSGASRGTGKRIAIVGSGPAGLACAQQLARAGHAPTVFEKTDRIGGLLRYGIPDFKMEKRIIDRRIEQMEAEGVIFRPNMEVGSDGHGRAPAGRLSRAGARRRRRAAARSRRCPGRELDGVHFAMDFLTQQNKRERRRPEERAAPNGAINATASTSSSSAAATPAPTASAPRIRQGAASVTQLEILPQPPVHENKALTWPDWPMKLRTSSSHEEGAEREFSVLTQAFVGENGKVAALQCVRVPSSSSADGRRKFAWSPARSSRSRPSSSCWRWASSVPAAKARSKARTSR